MNFFVFTKKPETIKKIFPKNTVFLPFTELSEHMSKNENISYIDISGLSETEIKKLTSQAKTAKDKNKQEETGTTLINNGIKLPSAGSFPGWKKLQSGKVMPFYLLYCSLHGKISLDDRFDSKTVAQIHKRFLNVLENNLMEGEGILWMNSGKDCLFLFPPKEKCINEAIKACIRMLVNAPLITLEDLNLKIPANFCFALHYGSVNYKPPGKTGTIVSDAVNFIFHLGAKKTVPGRLSVSDELPGKTISAALQDSFVPAGEFEGRKIWHTKKFNYPKPWF